MLKTHGIFNLGKVIQESKTKNGDTYIMFSAATQRGEQTDWILCKVFGRMADYFIKNLTKNNEGKYRSRKMMIEGVVEIFDQDKEIELSANVKPDAIPQHVGYLTKEIKVKVKTFEKMKECQLLVNYLEFVDKKKEDEIEIVLNDTIDSENYKQALNYSDNPDLTDTIKAATKGLSNIKSVEELN